MEELLIIGLETAQDQEVLCIVEREGYGVLKAADQAEGLEMFRAEQPAVVMVDHYLQEGDGLEVLKEVRKTDPGCEVILVTPGGEMDVAIEVLKAGALDYLRQPIDMTQLQIALGRARERGQKQKAIEPPAILVLEDDESTRRRLAHILEKEGYRIHAAADGEEGMRLFQDKRFDLILADVKMPRKDGLEVLRETKGAEADVEVIVISGYGDEEIVVQALRNGAINFLRKPIDIEQMLLAIQKALDFQTIRRSLAYRNRDVEIMQEIVIRLTRELELIVETPEKMSPDANEFLQELVNALPVGIVVVGSDRRIMFANRCVINTVGQSPVRLSTDWLEKMGVANVSQEDLDTSLARTARSRPGSIETLFLSKWAFLVMTPLKLVRPDRSTKFVVLAIRGERRPKKD